MSHIFFELHPKLSRALRRIRKTRLVYEREADGRLVWWEQSDPEEEPPDEIERSRSNHTFFASPDGEGFTFETEAEGTREPEFMTDDLAETGWGEEPPVSRISGTGKTGWVGAVSFLAPFASESERVQNHHPMLLMSHANDIVTLHGVSHGLSQDLARAMCGHALDS